MGGRTSAWLWGLLLLSFALRIGFDLARERPLRSDEIDYDRLAWNLSSAGTYSDEGVPTAYRPIGYPAFVAAVYHVVGRHPMAVRAVQALLDTATVALLFLVLAPRSRAAAWMAALAWALYPPAIVFAGLIVGETFFTLLLVAFLVLYDRGALRSGPGAAALGALLGILVLIKPAMALVLPALLVLWAFERIPARRAILFACAALIVIAPWVVRNGRVLGSATLATSAGPNLLIGNHPGASGGYAPDIPPEMRPPGGREADVDAASRGAAIRYIARNPVGFLEGGILKLAHLFMSEGETAVFAFHEDPADPRTRFREKYRSLPVWLHVAMSVPYALILLGGVLGLAARPSDALGRAFLVLLGVWIAIHFVFFGESRFHFPLMAAFTIFAAQLVTGGTGWVKNLSFSRRAVVLSAWAFFLVVWASEIAVVAGA